MDDAVDIARALGGRRSGKRYICRCPVSSHGRGRGDRNPSLSICDGDRGLMVNCFAGCEPRDVLGVLRERGLIGSKVTAFRKRIAQRCSVTLHEPDRNALTIWQESDEARRQTSRKQT
jgi:putative DNA primase/helicase